MVEIKQFNDGDKGYFIPYVNGKPAGKMTYTFVGDKAFIIDHTEVNKKFKGQNIGKQLVMKAIGFAKENDMKIIPLCPFAKAIMAKMEEIKDLIS
jgi:predicted GNAT family acetyltransferase